MAGARTSPSRGEAEEIAILALSFLAGDTQRLERFLSLSGLTPENLRVDAASPLLLAAVLEHLMNDEALLLTFAANAAVDPARVAAARDVLQAEEPPPDAGAD